MAETMKFIFPISIGGSIFFLGSYLVNQYNGIELEWFLYIGLVFFAFFILLFSKKIIEKNK